jgi:hypothetical protein
MSERAPIAPPISERSPREQDPAAPLVDALRELRIATNENPNNIGESTDTPEDDGEKQVWDDLGPNGIDGAYEACALIDAARKDGNPNKELSRYEQKTIDFFRTEIDLNRAQSHVDLAKLDAPIDGVENPRNERIQQIIAELVKDRAQINPTDTVALQENKSKIKTLTDYMESLKTPGTGHEARDYINSSMLTATTSDQDMRKIFRAQSEEAEKHLDDLAVHNLVSTEAYAILAQYYPTDPLDASDLPDDPRLEYVASSEAPADNTPTVPIDTIPVTPDPVAVTPNVPQSTVASTEAKASEDLDREMLAAELSEFRARMADASRGIFGAPSPELETEYRKCVAAAGKIWLEGELKRRGITHPTPPQEIYLAAQFAAAELHNLTTAKQAADEKTIGTKFVNMVNEHPILASGAAAGLLFASGVGIPASIAGAAGLVIYSKIRKKTRGIRNANQFLVGRKLQDHIAKNTLTPTGAFYRDELFDVALSHTSDAFAGEQRRERAKAAGVPAELERFISRYARRLGGVALNGAGATNPARQSAYAFAT